MLIFFWATRLKSFAAPTQVHMSKVSGGQTTAAAVANGQSTQAAITLPKDAIDRVSRRRRSMSPPLEASRARVRQGQGRGRPIQPDALRIDVRDEVIAHLDPDRHVPLGC